jgi:hypothetical protein
MTNAAHAAKACSAALNDGLMVCERCGQEWLADAAARPACDPITFETLCARMRSDEAQAEVSLKIVRTIKAEGGPGNSDFALRRLAEVSAARRLVERCAGSAQIRAILNSK